MLEKVSEHYQAHVHLEHIIMISDYLLRGPGIWWKQTPQGIVFLDGSDEKEYQDNGPTLQHFRSMSSIEVELQAHLLQPVGSLLQHWDTPSHKILTLLWGIW